MGLLALHVAMAERSLIQENPTVDEVVHLPAGITYWQKHTFRLYHHNPPLIKMIAALPVVWAQPVTAPVYQQPSWTSPDPSPTTFSQTFAYFEHRSLLRAVSPGPDGHAALFGARRTDRFRLVAQIVRHWRRALEPVPLGLLP